MCNVGPFSQQTKQRWYRTFDPLEKRGVVSLNGTMNAPDWNDSFLPHICYYTPSFEVESKSDGTEWSSFEDVEEYV